MTSTSHSAARLWATMLLAATLAATARAAEPALIPFQGRLTDQQGSAYTNGQFTILFQLYDQAVGGGSIWQERHEKVGVINGMVNALLGSIAPLTSVSFSNTKHLGITVDADNNPNTPDPEMIPRQMIIPAFWSKYAERAGFTENAQSAQTAQVAINLQVSNRIGLRLEYPTAGMVPNLVGGYSGNTVGAGAEGSVIVGGGASGTANSIGLNSDYSFIGSGSGNNIWGGGNFIGAGYQNNISGGGNFIGGGFQNRNYGDTSFIGGGFQNMISSNASYATIAGGFINNISRIAYQATIAGGKENSIGVEAYSSFIGGGEYNMIFDNAFSATISGGSGNGINDHSYDSTIGGGHNNVIGISSQNSTIGGGSGNRIANSSPYATIAGGSANEIELNSGNSVIGGGQNNRISSNSTYAVIPGGGLNTVGTNASTAFAAGFQAKANHYGSFVWGDQSEHEVASTNANSVTFRASGGMRFFSSTNTTSPAPGVYLARNSSSWSTTSDRNAKKDFAPVDGVAVLEALLNVPVQRWHYNWEQTSATPHIGPMAQDFKAAFYPGRDDKSITTLEFDGVALAAIQGLNQKVADGSQKSQARIQKLEVENSELRKNNAALEQRLSALEKLINRLGMAENEGQQ